MFDVLFGWRKASKCKKQIRRVQCRLKLLKNKRNCIVKQLRADVAELLKHGHEHSAFERVEQIFKDELMVEAYDLLENYCEFIIINLPYIRKHRNCPSDISEAASTLIFASSRFGDLPELLTIRKLFGERFGHKFATAALELLPENLVNCQINENVSIKNVPEEEKYRLINEIARSSHEPEPLLLEYKQDWQYEQETNSGKQISRAGTQTDNDNQIPNLQDSNVAETVVYANLSSDSKKLSEDATHSYKDSDTVEPSNGFSTGQKIFSPRKQNSLYASDMVKFTISEPESPKKRLAGDNDSTGMADSSSSESSAKSPELMVYLDDIEEFTSKDGSFQDQRLFVFRPRATPLKERRNNGNVNSLQENFVVQNGKSVERSSRKNRTASARRLRRRSISQESRDITDAECAVYYGEARDISPSNSQKLSRRTRHLRRKSVEEKTRKSFSTHQNKEQASFVKTRNSFSVTESTKDRLQSSCSRRLNMEIGNKCSLKNPSDDSTADGNASRRNSSLTPKKTTETRANTTAYRLEEERKDYRVELDRCSSREERDDNVIGEERETPYLRAMTMPCGRPKETPIGNILRSKSYPVEPTSNLSNGSSSHRHIHPKLPDYDKLEAKFMALKEAYIQNKQQLS